MNVSSLRIVAVADLWFGSNGDAFVRAFRRLGHSVRVVPVEGYLATEWRTLPLYVLRRALEPALQAEYNRALLAACVEHEADVLFVYKGRHVRPETIRAVRARGALALNVYPDVSLLAHGRLIPRALPEYDWVFHTKKYGLPDLERLLGVRRASVLPHGFDPDVHRPIALDARDAARYACDVSFIGTWSPKKQTLLERLSAACPDVHLRIWGSQWERARGALGARVQGRTVTGLEYSKALIASRINLGIMSEVRVGASSGDQITSRTFQIPATGAFLLHERTSDFLELFEGGTHCDVFSTPEELIEKVRLYLGDDRRRQELARAGRRHVVEAGHSIDDRAQAVLAHASSLARAEVR